MKIDVFELNQEDDFENAVDRFLVKKRFRHLPEQIKDLSGKLRKGEFEGDKISHKDYPTPHDVYKLRLPNPDTGVGKSNGYRVIYMVVMESEIVVLLTIYYKKEQATVSDTYIAGLIDGYFFEFTGGRRIEKRPPV